MTTKRIFQISMDKNNGCKALSGKCVFCSWCTSKTMSSSFEGSFIRYLYIVSMFLSYSALTFEVKRYFVKNIYEMNRILTFNFFNVRCFPPVGLPQVKVGLRSWEEKLWMFLSFQNIYLNKQRLNYFVYLCLERILLIQRSTL